MAVAVLRSRSLCQSLDCCCWASSGRRYRWYSSLSGGMTKSGGVEPVTSNRCSDLVVTADPPWVSEPLTIEDMWACITSQAGGLFSSKDLRIGWTVLAWDNLWIVARPRSMRKQRGFYVKANSKYEMGKKRPGGSSSLRQSIGLYQHVRTTRLQVSQ